MEEKIILHRRGIFTREKVCEFTKELDKYNTGKWNFPSYLLNINNLETGAFAIRVPGSTVGVLRTVNNKVVSCSLDVDCIGADNYYKDSVTELLNEMIGKELIDYESN